MRSVFLFGGLGGGAGPALTQLRGLYGEPENAPFFSAAFAAVRRGLEQVGRQTYERHLPAGLPLHDWVSGAATPDPGRVASSVVEGLCAHLCQLCLLQPRAGRPPVVTLGHSLGMYAAVVASMGLADRRAYIRSCRTSITMLVLTLLRAHQVSGGHEADPELAREYLTRARATTPPGPMAGISGLGRREVQAVVDRHNRTTGADAVEVGLVNGSRSYVLTGSADALVRLWRANADPLTRPGVKWFFLGSTAPFHSSRLAAAVRLLEADVADIAPTSGAALRVPVYATAPVTNLQRSQHLYVDLAWQSLCHQLDWQDVLSRTVGDHAPDTALYFGPGLSAQVFTKTFLRERGYPLAETVVSHR